MAKGMSPLRLFMRNAPRKTVADGNDRSVSGHEGTAQSRQPLGSITETVRNPLVTVAEQSSGDSSTPRAKAKVSHCGQENFPLSENSEVFATSTNSVPDKSASSQPKSGKLTWQHRQGATARNVPKEGPFPLNTQLGPPKGDGCSDGQAANSQDTLQSVSHHSRECSSGGGSVSSTPKIDSLVGGKSSETENGGSQSQNITSWTSVPRSLKCSQQESANDSGESGPTNVRSTLSQHVVTGPMDHLQAVQGFIAQAANPNFVEHHFEMEEDASFRRNHNVQVIIRTRPLSNSELSQGSNRCLKQESPHVVRWLGQPESRFTFDHVAGETITQAKLFDVAGLPMVENCMSGYNSCMFAYGQTGSGKTHTMLGDIENLDRMSSENRGMTPRVFECLFARIQTEQECRRHEHLKFFCKCSFLEIYNEQITDLLEPSSTNLQMREDAKKGVYVENLSEVEVQCVQDVIQLLLQGAANRKVAATNMNRESSRSHSVFTCVVESKWESNSMTNSRYGRLHLVDLAGSERQKSSGAEGGRLREAANINKSLSTLGLVIMILVDVANGKQRHIPYRDSKLTFLLQDSLGGNSKTVMIANVSPASCCAMETLSTLKFARRAKFIRNNAVINEDASGDVIALRQEIVELKVQVDRLRRERSLRVPSSRILALENGSVAGQMCGDKSDALTIECSTLDSRNANNSQTVNTVKQFRSVEAVLAGALRREHLAEDITKRLAAEIEQLNRLVRQREEDSQCSKTILRLREEKIRRLEGIADNVISAEAFYEDERKNLNDELQLVRGRLDRNPELTRFAMENIRLMEELRRYQEFYDGGERDVLLEEISGLRSQILDLLDTKVGAEQTIGKLLTPQIQKWALVPESSALQRENELLLVEVKGYQNEVKECRNNLNACLVANADLSRQVEHLQATVKQLKSERSQKYDESSELPDRLFSGANLRVPQATSSVHPATAHIQLETEELDLQQRQTPENFEEQVLELQNQLKEAQDLIQKLSSEVQEAHERSDRRTLEENTPVVKQGLQDRWEKLQEIEMRHSEEITQLQLELDSTEEALKEERQQRFLADQKIDDLSSQFSATVSKLEEARGLAEVSSTEERQQRLVVEQRSEELSGQLSAAVSKLQEVQCVVEALEGQLLFSINELENLQSEHTKLLRKMRQHEEGEVELQNQFKDEYELDDGGVAILEKKLLRTKRDEEEVSRINRQFQQEKASRMALDKERELTLSEVETQAALAITTLQSEILELKEEISLGVKFEGTAKLQISHLQEEVKRLRQTVEQLEVLNRCLSDKLHEHKNLVDGKNAELRGLEMDWESSASKLIDLLSDDDIVEKRDTAESVYHRFEGVQLTVKETEGEVMTSTDAEVTETTSLAFEDDDAMIRESQKKSMVAFVMVRELLERTRGLKSAQHRLVQENHEAFLRKASTDIQAAALQQQLEELRRQYEELEDEHGRLICEREGLREQNRTSTRIRFDLTFVNAEVEERERTVCNSFRRSQQTLERVEGLLVTVEQELGGLEISQRSLEKDVLLLESAATVSSVVSEEQEHKYLELQRRVENAEIQMHEMQAASDSVMAQVLLERDHLEANKRRMKDENECIPGLEGQKHFEPAEKSSRQKQEIQLLRAKISEKDKTILSAKKEMRIAIANLKEAELEMDKIHRENHRLTQIQLENKSLIESLSLEFKTAGEELLKRDIKIEGCEAELQKVVGVMSDWETKMHDVEIERKKEKESLAQQLTEAKLVANENKTEAAALYQKFQDGQATLKEAEDLVDALVQANENAKHDALDWKAEKESLGIVREWWMPERHKLVSKIARLENDMHTQQQDIWIMCNEEVDGLVATMDLLLGVDKELSELKNDHQQDLGHVAVEMRALKGDLVAGLFDLEGKLTRTFEEMQTVVHELTSQKDQALKDLANLKDLKEQRVAQSLHTMSSELKAVENERDKYRNDLLVLRKQLETAQTLADAGEIFAAEANQAAKRSKRRAEDKEDKEEEARILERSVEELDGTVSALESQVCDLKVLKEQRYDQSLHVMRSKLKAVENERDKYHNDLLVLRKQLETAQTLADAGEIFASEANQAAERSKRRAEEKEEEARILERSVEELESTVCSLESQVCDLKALKEQRVAQSLHTISSELKATENERDKYHNDLLVLREQLETVQTLADAGEIFASEANQAAERSKRRAEEKEEEARILERSVEELESTVCSLESQVCDLKVSKEQRVAQSLHTKSSELKAVESERDKYHNDLLVLREQLETAQTLAEAGEIFASDANQAVERSNRRAEEKEEEARILERSVEELESSVYALESQLDIVKRESQRQSVVREALEKEVEALKLQMGLMQVTIDSQDAQAVRDIQAAEALKSELDRMVIEMKNQQLQARKSVESLQQECAEKDVQLRSCKAQIAELMWGAEKQTVKHQQKLDSVNRKSERQRVAKEALERELEALKCEIGLMQAAIETQEAQLVRDIQGAETSKTELDRIVIETKIQQIQACKSVESLQEECAEKDVQLRSCKAHITELMLGAEKQASEHQQKLKTLEVMVRHLNVEERKARPAGGSVSKAVEKSTGKAKGAGSPFKCIGLGLEKQRYSDVGEDLSTAKKRIKELEALAASRQKEVFMLNTKLAEAESMTHDVIRDLLGVKMDIASYATLLNQKQVQRNSERARRRTEEARQKEDELDALKDSFNQFSEDRESSQGERNGRQSGDVAAWVSAEKRRLGRK